MKNNYKCVIVDKDLNKQNRYVLIYNKKRC